MDGPDAVGDLLEAQPLPHEHAADVYEALVPLDAAVAADQAHLEVTGVLERWQPLGVRAWRGLIETRRRLPREGVVRTLLVVDVEKAIELPLQRRIATRRQPRGVVH